MSVRRATLLALVAVMMAIGALGNATWINWKIQESVSRLAREQERNLKGMMISVAHTEGQLGRIKEAMNAFDLEKWVATVQGPLVDRLAEKMAALQREVVGQEVAKWAREISREQTERANQRQKNWQSVAELTSQLRADIEKQTKVTNELGASIKVLERDYEKLVAKHYEKIETQFVQLQKETNEIRTRLSQSEAPATSIRAVLAGIEKENRRLTELLEQRVATSQEFQLEVQENLERLADEVAQREAAARQQVDEAAKRWQGLFLTLRENHEAELESHREVLRRLEEERARAVEEANELRAARTRRARRRATEAREKVRLEAQEVREQQLGELIEFCTRRPESVLCRDLEIR